MKQRFYPNLGHFALLIPIFILIVIFAWSPARSAGAASRLDTVKLAARQFTPDAGIEAAVYSQRALLNGSRQHVLVQLDDLADAGQLAAAGVQLLDYIPDNTYIASVAVDADLSRLPLRWVGALQPTDKVDSLLADGRALAWTMSDDGRLNLLLSVYPDVDMADAAAIVAAFAGEVTAASPEMGLLVVTVPAGSLYNLAAVDAIAWVSPVAPTTNELNASSRELIHANNLQAAPYSLTGAGVVAGVWDEGFIDNSHPDFVARVTQVGDGAVNGHSTHVGGTLAGDGSASANNYLRGMAPATYIFSWDVDYGSTLMQHGDAINTYGVDVSQNSWGYQDCSFAGNYNLFSARYYDGIVNGSIYSRAIPIIFAAGNLGTSCASQYGTVLGGPTSAKNVLTVGAVNAGTGALASFSSWGPTLDGRIKPEVVASGVGVISTLPGGGYGGYNGTSMAAPAASGAISLLLERYHQMNPGGGDAAGNPTPALIRALLVHTAEDMNDVSLAHLNPGPDFASGFGQIDIQQAVDMLPFHVEGSLTTGVVDAYSVEIANQSELKVTLAWDDVMAAANAAPANVLVNNLDLELVAPDGTTVYGPWLLDATPGNESNAAQRPVWTEGGTAQRDNRNVIEQVVVDNPMPGTWTIRVRGSNVPSGPQAYALVSQALTVTSLPGTPPSDVTIDLSFTSQGADAAPNWFSNDVWIRQTLDTTLTYAHQDQDVEFGQTNYIYLDIHNPSDTVAQTVTAFVYGADPAVGISWPSEWTLLGSTTAANIAAGGNQIAAPIAWNPPQPADAAGTTYSLYVRLVAVQDPITIVETADPVFNAQNDDNITGRNVTIKDSGLPDPTIIDLAGAGTITPVLPLGVVVVMIGLAALTFVAFQARSRQRRWVRSNAR